MYAICTTLSIMACGPVYGNEQGSGGGAEASPVPAEMDWSMDPVDLAIERWEAYDGPVSASCEEYARGLEVEWIESREEITDRCNVGIAVQGCFTWRADGTPYIMMRVDACNVIFVHEYLHALYACQHRETNCDPEHKDPVWKSLEVKDQGCSSGELYSRPFDNPKQKASK